MTVAQKPDSLAQLFTETDVEQAETLWTVLDRVSPPYPAPRFSSAAISPKAAC